MEQYYGPSNAKVPHLTKLNHVVAHDSGSGNVFPYIDKTITRYYGGATAPKDTAQEFAYDLTNGNLKEADDLGWVDVSDPAGYQYAIHSDPNNKPVYTSYTYDTTNPTILNRPKTVIVSDGPNGGGNLLRGTIMTYNGSGNLKTRSRYLDTVSGYVQDLRLRYDGMGNIKSQTDATGVTTKTVQFDTDNMYPIQQTLGNHFTVYATYDARSGLATNTTDQTGLVTVYKYDPFFRLKLVNVKPAALPGDPVVSIRQVTYAYSSGSPMTNYVAKSIFYNDDRSINPIDPVGSIASPPVVVDAISTNGNALTTFSYSDGFGRPTQSRTLAEDNSNYRVVHTAYDNLGRETFVSDPVFEAGSGYNTSMPASGTSIAYDHFNRVLAVTPPVGDTNSPTAPSSAIYNLGGDPWATMTVDAKGKTQNTYHNARGNIVRVTEIMGSGANATGSAGTPYDTFYGYDALGQLTGVKNVAGHQTAISYDGVGNKRQTVDPNAGTTTYVYDVAGRLLSQTDAKQQTTTFHYGDSDYPDPNQSGRLTAKILTDVSGNKAKPILFDYDAPITLSNGAPAQYTVRPGQLARVRDLQGSEYYSYDGRGRLSTKSRLLDVENTHVYTTTLAYDNASRVTAVGYPLGLATVQYQYDQAGNLISAATPGGTPFYSASGFDAFGDPNQETLGDRSTTTYSYYPGSKRLQGITASGVPGLLQQMQYSYDPSGQLTSVTDKVNPSGPASGAVASVVYDDLYRMTVATTAAQGTLNYTYDPIGRITQNGNASQTYGYDNGSAHPQALASFGGTSYNYDACGNRAGTSVTTSTPIGGIFPNSTSTAGARFPISDYSTVITGTYQYDSENQLIRVYGGSTSGVYGGPTSGAGGGSTALAVSSEVAAASTARTKSLQPPGIAPHGPPPPPVYAPTTYDESFGYDFTGARLWKRNNLTGVYTLYVDGLYEFRPMSSQRKNLYHVYANGRLVCTFEPSSSIAGNFIQNHGLLAQTATGLKGAIDWVFHTQPRLELSVLACMVLLVGGFLVWVNLTLPSGVARRQFPARAGPRRLLNALLTFSKQALACLLTVTMLFSTTRTACASAAGSTYDPVFYFYHQDHLGSSKVITDASGEVVQQYGYAPYGVQTYQANTSAFPLSNLFTGQDYDAESGLYFYGSRYYDPATATFIQPDTEVSDPFDPQSLNRYSYVQNNPLNAVDPTGHDPLYFSSSSSVSISDGVATVYGSFSASFSPFPDQNHDNPDPTNQFANFIPSQLLGIPGFKAGTGPSAPPPPASPTGGFTVVSAISTVANLGSIIPGPVGSVFGIIGAGAELYQGHYGAAALGAGGAILNLVGVGGVVNAFKFIRSATGIGKIAQEASAATGIVREVTSIGKAATAAEEGITVASGIGRDIRPAALVRTIQQGELLKPLETELAQLTYVSEAEHAIISLRTGERVIVSGGKDDISFGENLRRVLLHTHPTTTGPSNADFVMLAENKQVHSYIYELFGGGRTRFNAK